MTRGQTIRYCGASRLCEERMKKGWGCKGGPRPCQYVAAQKVAFYQGLADLYKTVNHGA